MSDELQNNDEVDIQQEDNFKIVENTIDENSTKVEAELAPEVTEQSADDKQQKIDQAFKKEYAKRKQAERDAEALQKQLEEIKVKSTKVPAEIGDMPNEYDFDTIEEFEAAKSQFVDNVRARTEYDAQQKLQVEHEQRTQAEAAQKQYAEMSAKVQTYSETAEKLGISSDELARAGQAVQSYGVSDDIASAILSDSDGPLMTQYLAGNPLEVENLSRMNPIQAGIYLATTVKAAASALKPKSSNAVQPATHLEGGATKPNDDHYDNLGGVTFS